MRISKDGRRQAPSLQCGNRVKCRGTARRALIGLEIIELIIDWKLEIEN